MLLLALSGFCFIEQAHADAWRDLALSANRASKQGNIEESKTLWLRALGEAQKLGTQNPWYSASLRNLGTVHMLAKTLPDQSRAEVYFHEELEILKPLGPDYCDRVYDLYSLGRIKAVLGHFEESLWNYNEATRIWSKYYSPLVEVYLHSQVPMHALGHETEEKRRQQEFLKLFQIDGGAKRYAPQRIANLCIKGVAADGFTAKKHSDPWLALNTVTHFS